MELISFKGATIEREEQVLFDGVDFSVASGEFVYLIGRVGSGKSSLLQAIYAELPVASGTARVLDFDLRRMKRSRVPRLRRRLGIVFQDFQLLTDRTVEENLRFVLRATGWSHANDIRDRIEAVLAHVGMENKGYRMPNTLSGGEQQRVVIARALLNNPDIILADEPTGNLDPETGESIVGLLHDICRRDHTAVVMSTHNLHLAERFPGRVLRVEEGQLVDVTRDYCPAADTEEMVMPNAEEASATEEKSEEASEEAADEPEATPPAPEEAADVPEATPPAPEEAADEPEVTPPAPEEATPHSEESPAETQNASPQAPADNRNDEDHC